MRRAAMKLILFGPPLAMGILTRDPRMSISSWSGVKLAADETAKNGCTSGQNRKRTERTRSLLAFAVPGGLPEPTRDSEASSGLLKRAY